MIVSPRVSKNKVYSHYLIKSLWHWKSNTVVEVCTFKHQHFIQNHQTSATLYYLEAKTKLAFGLLICTLIEKSRSISNPRKISGQQTLIFFFQVWHLHFFQVYNINPTFYRVETWKKVKVCRTWNFSKILNRPWFLTTLIFRK